MITETMTCGYLQVYRNEGQAERVCRETSLSLSLFVCVYIYSTATLQIQDAAHVGTQRRHTQPVRECRSERGHTGRSESADAGEERRREERGTTPSRTHDTLGRRTMRGWLLETKDRVHHGRRKIC